MEQKEATITLCGGAGQGIQTVEALLAPIIQKWGLHIFATKEYMSRIRKGLNSTTLRVSENRVLAPVDRIDLLIALDAGAQKHLGKRIGKNTRIIGDPQNLEGHDETFPVPFIECAKELGSEIYSNVVALGSLCRIFGIPKGHVYETVSSRFKTKGDETVNANIKAVDAGYDIGNELVEKGLSFDFDPQTIVKNELLLDGHKVLALGAIAGGCDFVSAYPMSPATGVVVSMADMSRKFDIVVEQAEDEISAINMCIGASYAGARPMVSTSGGGFALMGEGVSLAGITETPVVIHIGQRPGPATGLPTRTEQADLDLALYSGHGEFPRAVFAPGNLSQLYEMSQKAFYLAEKYQTPMFILSDQHLMDMYHNMGRWDLKTGQNDKSAILRTESSYKRYLVTESGVSPRGVPGHGEGLIYSDSDEHCEHGRITEDMDVRKTQVEKRLRKSRGIKEEIIKPTFMGDTKPTVLIVCWGSTLEAASEAVIRMDAEANVSVLHFGQVHPLPEGLNETLESARKTLALEGNAKGQFADLIKIKTGHEFTEKALKYDGHQFTVEQVIKEVRGML